MATNVRVPEGPALPAETLETIVDVVLSSLSVDDADMSTVSTALMDRLSTDVRLPVQHMMHTSTEGLQRQITRLREENERLREALQHAHQTHPVGKTSNPYARLVSVVAEMLKNPDPESCRVRNVSFTPVEPQFPAGSASQKNWQEMSEHLDVTFDREVTLGELFDQLVSTGKTTNTMSLAGVLNGLLPPETKLEVSNMAHVGQGKKSASSSPGNKFSAFMTFCKQCQRQEFPECYKAEATLQNQAPKGKAYVNWQTLPEDLRSDLLGGQFKVREMYVSMNKYLNQTAKTASLIWAMTDDTTHEHLLGLLGR